MEDEDEVLVSLAEELGNFDEHIGGSQFAHVLLGPLQHLATVEEPLVRYKVRTQWGKSNRRPWSRFVKSAVCFLHNKQRNISCLLSELFPRRTGLLLALLQPDYMR
jgi:hypothetical protein